MARIIKTMKFNNSITKSKSSVKIDISEELEGTTKLQREAIKEIVGETILEGIAQRTSQQKSPVAGGQYKSGLSESYRKQKGSNVADLVLQGDMLNSIKVKTTKTGKTVELVIDDETEAAKSYHHNTGSRPAGNFLPKRQFLPTKKDGEFTKTILNKIKKKVKQIKGEGA